MEASPMDLAQGDLPRPSMFEDLPPITDVPNLPVDFPPIIPIHVKIEREQYLKTPEGKTRLADYERYLIRHINSYVNEDGRWEYNEMPDEHTQGQYHMSKVKLLRGLELLDPKKYPILEDMPEGVDRGAGHTESYFETPYLTKSEEQLSIMKDIHDKIDFSESKLHNQLIPPPTSENLELYMDLLEQGDKGHYFNTEHDID